MNTIPITHILTVTLLSTLALCVQTANAEDGKFSLSSGLDYNYGKYESGHLAIKLVVPSGAIPGGALSSSANSAATASIPGRVFLLTGDPQPASNETEAAATYRIYPGGASRVGIDLTGRVKLKPADKYLGLAGLNDFAAQADAYQNFDRFKALGSLGYKAQENPAGISTEKLLYGSVGGAYQLNDQLSGGINFSLSQSPPAVDQRQKQLSAYVSHNINNNLKARGYILKDYSNNAPDHSVGAAVSYGF